VDVDRAFSALTLLVGCQEGHLTCKKTEWLYDGMVMCLGQVSEVSTDNNLLVSDFKLHLYSSLFAFL